MLRWAMIFLMIALVAMLFGSGQVASLAGGMGQFLLIAFVVIAIVGMIASAFRRA